MDLVFTNFLIRLIVLLTDIILIKFNRKLTSGGRSGGDRCYLQLSHQSKL